MKSVFFAAALLASLATQALADPKADVRTAFAALAKMTSYHMTAMGKGHTVDIDVVNPGKLHVVMAPMEMIKIDTTTYVKMNGTWQKFNFPGADRFASPVQHVQSLAARKDDLVVTDLGPKTVDGAALHAYGVKDSSSDANATSTVYLDGSGNLVRIENGDGAVVLSKFNAPIAIDAPI